MDNLTKRNILRKTIILCWSALIICFGIKLLGGNYFEIFAKSEKFIELCNWVDGNFIGTMIMYGFYCMNLYILIAIMSESEFKERKLLLTIPISVACCYIKGLSSTIGFILETLYMLIMSIAISKNSKKITTIRFSISYILINVFQIISLCLRSIHPQLVDANFYVSLLFQVDYYIMLILYYLYSVKLKGVKK